MKRLNIIGTFDKNLLEFRFGCHDVFLKKEASDAEEEVSFSLMPVNRAHIYVELSSLLIIHYIPGAIGIVADVLPRVGREVVKTEVALYHLLL